MIYTRKDCLKNSKTNFTDKLTWGTENDLVPINECSITTSVQ